HFTIQFRKAAFDFNLNSPLASNIFESKRVLIVGPEDYSRESLVSQVVELGMDVQVHSETYSISSAANYDLAFVDVGIEGLSGGDLVSFIREKAGAKDLPVILSGRLGSVQTSDMEGGRVFSILKPFKLSSVKKYALEALGQGAPKVRKSQSNGGKKMGEEMPLRILLAEDNAVNQKVAKRLFTKLGYEIKLAGNGLEAIKAIAEGEYDLVFMDIQMPEMDGLEATRQIISRWGDERPRIIALTANAMREDRENCYAAGMDDYLTKPFKQSELKDVVAKTFRKLQGKNIPNGVVGKGDPRLN
ncbi:MAG: response regulator, partial [Verrucomicrobiota bacterium]